MCSLAKCKTTILLVGEKGLKTLALETADKANGDAARTALYLTSPVNRVEFPKFATDTSWSDGL
jgi:hypothetical protein